MQDDYECPDVYNTKENYKAGIKYLYLKRLQQMALGKRKRSNTYSVMVRGKQVKVPVARFKGGMGNISRSPYATRGFYGVGTRFGRPELKTIDSGNTTYAALDSSTGNSTLLNGVTNNTDYNARIGRVITMKSILLRFQWYPLTTQSDSNGDVLRALIVIDLQANGVAPAITDILDTASYLAPNNLANRNRFVTLYDKMFNMSAWTMSAGALVNGGVLPRAQKIYKKINQDTIFNATGATVGSIQSGSLYFFVIPATNGTTGLVFNARVRFIDK